MITKTQLVKMITEAYEEEKKEMLKRRQTIGNKYKLTNKETLQIIVIGNQKPNEPYFPKIKENIELSDKLVPLNIVKKDDKGRYTLTKLGIKIYKYLIQI